MRPVRRLDGASPNYVLNAVQIAFNNANKIGKGDPVMVNAAGFIDLWTAGNPIAGVFWGCEYLDPVNNYVNWFNAWTAPTLPSTTTVTAYIIADQNLVFAIRADTIQVTQGNVYNNASISLAGGANVTSAGYSAAKLTAIATTATLPLKIVGLNQTVGNDNTSAGNIAEVVLNNYAFAPNTAGV